MSLPQCLLTFLLTAFFLFNTLGTDLITFINWPESNTSLVSLGFA
jgi:hypothetical protein